MRIILVSPRIHRSFQAIPKPLLLGPSGDVTRAGTLVIRQWDDYSAGSYAVRSQMKTIQRPLGFVKFGGIHQLHLSKAWRRATYQVPNKLHTVDPVTAGFDPMLQKLNIAIDWQI
jgi:hypothetical protein